MFWSYTGGTPSAANLSTIAGLIGTAWATNLASLMTTAGALSEVDVTDLASNTGAVGTSTTSHAGTRSGLEPTTGTCLVAKYTIARHYRGGKPKGFWPFGLTSDLVDQHLWSTAFVSACNTGFAAFQSGVNGLVGGPITLGTQQNVSYFSGTQTNPSTSKWARRNRPAPRGTPL